MFCPIEQDKRWIKLLSFLKDRDKAIYYWNVYEENIPDYFYDSLPIQDTSNTEVQSDPLSISIKPGVQELFESNPELANAVYDVLGFKQVIQISSKEEIVNLFKELVRVDTLPFEEVKKQGLLSSQSETVEVLAKQIAEKSIIENINLNREDYNDIFNNVDSSRLIAKVNDYKDSLREKLINKLLKERSIKKVDVTPFRKQDDTIYDASFYREYTGHNWAGIGTEMQYATSDNIILGEAHQVIGAYSKYKNKKLELSGGITSQQKQQALQLYSQYLESLNKPKTNPILQGNQQEQVKKFTELQERLSNKEFLEGAKNAFESSKGLQQFGTQEQYNDYIARVSLGIVKNPSSGEYNYDSKVKDIVYHGTGEIFEKFNKKRTYFAKELEYAKSFPDWQTKGKKENKRIISSIINIQNIRNVNEYIDNVGIEPTDRNILSFSNSDIFEKQTIKEGFDGLEVSVKNMNEYVIFEPEQIHILGSKQDIEGFKKFVQGKPKSVKPGVEELFESNPELPKKLENTLFGLDNNSLEFHINTLGVISNFLENIGVEQRLIPEFLAQDGSVVEGALAAANFIQGTVDIIDDLNKRPDAWNKLPEEAAHWWYRLLKDSSPLKKALWESHTTALKNDELYKTNYGKNVKLPSDLTEESIGQLIAEAIKRIETKNANASDYSFFKMFLEWLNSVIDIFRTTNQDPFEVAAMKILSSDMSDLMTWEEYRKLNNIVNFADVLTEQSVAPIDYTLIEDIGSKESRFQDLGDEIIIGWVFMFNDSQKESPVFENHEDLDSWVSANIPEHNERQYALIQEVKDNQQFFDRLLNKTFRKRSKYLAKTLRKYFNIIDAQNLNSLKEWNISKELQQVTKKLTEQEKKQIIETNGYTNIAPTLKVLPDLLQKYGRKTNPEIIKQEIEITNKLIKKEITKEEAVELRQKLENKKKGNPIVLSEPIKIDGAKKQELAILNGIKEMIKLENPSLKSITAEEFVAEAHNWLETNYLLGFANEQVYLSYRTDQTFTYLNDRNTNQDVRNLTDEELQNLPFEERQRLANTLGLTKQNPDVYHNKVSIRFNDMSHLKSGHFNLPGGGSPSAWGNLTYFYSGKNKWKDAVLLHEIQNDNIEFLRDYKAEKVDLETSLGRYLQQLNTDLIDNITQIETGGKTIQRNNLESSPKQYIQLDYLLQQLVEQPLEQGLNNLKQNLNEKIELYKSDDSVRNSPEKAKEHVDKLFSQRRKFVDFQKRGGIKSLLSKEDLESLKEIIKELNTGTVIFRNLKQKKQDFKFKSGKILSKINNKFKELYGEDVPIITLNAPAKPLPKAQRRGRIVNAGTTREIIIGNASQDLNESVNYLIAFSEQQIIKKFSKDIEESKKNYIRARNAYNSFNFNLNLVKITQEQYNNLIENYKYNQDLLNRLIDEQAQKDIKSPQLEKIAKAKSIIKYLGDDSSIKLGTGKYGFIWDTADTDKGIVSVWDAYKAGNTDEDSYIDNWSVDEFLEYVKKVAPEYLTLDTKSIDIKNQEFKFNELKQKALDKKEELEKNYGKLEEEIKQTLEIEMNYFTPLVHHLIQKHINQYGKDFPMYFSGYNITKLTQGNDRTALIYAGKDEINTVDKKQFKINSDIYATDEGSYNKTNPLESFNYFKNNNVISQQEYQKAYQQATERRAKEIKVEALVQMKLFDAYDGWAGTVNMSDSELDVAIKKLNEYKKQSKQNLDRVVNTIMNISGSEPIETGAIYNAMTQISGIKLIWQDKVDGLKNNAGGYLIDLSGYNYNTPILYGLTNKQDIEGFKEFVGEFINSTSALKTSLGKELEYKDPYVPTGSLKNFKQYQVLDEKNNDIGNVVIEYRGDKTVILHPKLTISGKGYGKDLYKLISSKFNVDIQEWNEGAIANSNAAKKMWDSLEKEGVAEKIVDEEQGDNFRILKYRKVISKQDIEGFKEFINNQTINNESTSDSVLTDEQIQESTEFLNQIGSDFKLEKLDTNEKVLEYVIDNSNDEPLKAVAKHLLKHLNKIDFVKFKGVVTLESKTIAGMYRKTTGDIYLNNNSTSRWTKEQYLETIIHEYIHAFTINALENPQTKEEKEFEKKIYNIFLELRKDSYFEDEYGFSNTKEFVSELLTNSDFRDKALHVRKNILDNIIDFIKELLGIKIKAKYSTKNEKLLETGFKTTLNFIPNSSPRLANVDKENGTVYYNDKVSSKNNPYYKQNIINRINSFNTLEELTQAWNSPKFTEEQKIEFKEYFTRRKEIILAHMKRAEDFRNYVKTNTGVFKTIKLSGTYNEFEAQITGNIVNGQIEVRTNTGKILLVTMSQLRDKNQDNNKDLSRINHRLSKFEFSDELRLLYNQLSEKYNYDMDKVHKDIILRPNVSFQPFFVNEENELVGVYYYSSEINPTFTRFAKSIQDSRASFLRDAMNNNFKLNIIQKYSPLAKYYPSKLVSFYYSLPENELKNLDKFLKKEGYEKIEDLFNNKIAIISEDDIIELLKCHI